MIVIVHCLGWLHIMTPASASIPLVVIAVYLLESRQHTTQTICKWEANHLSETHSWGDLGQCL